MPGSAFSDRTIHKGARWISDVIPFVERICTSLKGNKKWTKINYSPKIFKVSTDFFNFFCNLHVLRNFDIVEKIYN